MSFVVRTTATEMKVKSFENLAVGWHYGEGGPIEPEIIARALDIYEMFLLHGLTRTDAFAGVNGEVQITAYRADHFVSVTVERSQSFTLVHELPNDTGPDRYEDGLALEQLKQRLGEVAEIICPISASSTLATSTAQRAGSLIWHSSALQTAVGCLYSSSSAPKQLAA